MKKIILIMMFFTSLTFGANQILFWVENPEMVSAYHSIFSAIADIFAEGPKGKESAFINLLRLIFLVGGFFVFASGIFNSFGKGGDGAIGGYLKYLVIGVAILTLGFYKGDTEVWIIAKNTTGYCTTAQGGIPASPAGIYVGGTKTYDLGGPDEKTVKRQVPTLLAYAFYFTNKIGLTMTEIAEGAYSTPAMTNLEPQRMSKAGYMGALRGAMKLVAIDPAKTTLRSTHPTTGAARDPYDMGKAYKAMFSDCVLIPFSARGTQGALAIAKLKASSNIHLYLDNKFDAAGSEAATKIGGMIPRNLSLTYQGMVYNCGDFYTDVIKPIYTAFSSESVCGYGDDIGRGALSLIIGATTGAVSEFENVAVQAGLVSELEGSLSSLGVGVSGIGYASGKTRAEFIQSSLASGVYMAEMLPYLQMTIRAVLYGFFPFVFVMVLLPGGLKILGTFFQTIIWVELWSPTATIINMFMMSHATNQFSSIYGGSGLTLLSSVDMLSTGSTIAGIGGYLYLSVPALTWLIMKGSAQMLGNLTGAMSAGMARNITTSAINQDKALVAKTSEANARSGKDLSMAEMQHYEAIQGGRMEGAKLGVQMGAGMDTMADIETMKESKNVEEFKLLSSASGLGAAGIGASLAGAGARKLLEEVNTGLDVNQGGTLRRNTIDAARSKANETKGADNSNAKNPVTVADAEGAEDKKTSGKKADRKFMADNPMDDVVNANANAQQFKQNYDSTLNSNWGGVAADLFNKNTDIANDLMQENIKMIGGNDFDEYKKKIVDTKSGKERQEVATQDERKKLAKKNNTTIEKNSRGDERVDYRNKNIDRDLLEKKEDPNHPITKNDEVNNKFIDQVKKTNETEAILNDHSRDFDKVGNYFYTNQQTENFGQEVKNEDNALFRKTQGNGMGPTVARANAKRALVKSGVTTKTDKIAQQEAGDKVLKAINKGLKPGDKNYTTRNQLIAQNTSNGLTFSKVTPNGKSVTIDSYTLDKSGKAINVNTREVQKGEYLTDNVLRESSIRTATNYLTDSPKGSTAYKDMHTSVSTTTDVVKDMLSAGRIKLSLKSVALVTAGATLAAYAANKKNPNAQKQSPSEIMEGIANMEDGDAKDQELQKLQDLVKNRKKKK